MNHRFFHSRAFNLATLLLSALIAGQAIADDKLRIIAFGGHPDDCELQAAGVAARWAEAGHAVKFVSLTNGDVGHFSQSGRPLAERRKAEVEKCAEILGIETEVLNIHDGELMPTLENRKTVVRLIRDWQADVVFSHRPFDYHADHRATGELVHDSVYLVVAPFYTSDTAPLQQNPIILHFYDWFTQPKPFKPSIVVGIDDVAEKKWNCIRAMPSQFADKHAWQAQTRPGVPEGDAAREEYLFEFTKKRSADMADRYRDKLNEIYGDKKGNEIKYAEAFEVSQYGRQATQEELKKLFLVE